MRSRPTPTRTLARRPPDPGDGATIRSATADATSDETPHVVQLDAPPTATASDGRYTTVQTIGEGGMGVISLVHDRTIGRNVALKQMKALALDDRADVLRFEREARLQGQLEHPAIVPVYDIGKSAEGTPFFTMKRVRGEPLSDILALLAANDEATSQRFSRRRLLSAFSQLCLAVHYAHERGVVHRDIKPANVMLGRYGEVYLLDWGIAKVGEDGLDASSRPDPSGPPRTGRVDTADGTIIGTLSTMAPEQALGEPIDARADVYSLGAVLFEILTLSPLHERAEEEVMLERIVAGVDARPSVRVPDAMVPPELEALCVAATKRDREERLASALALHESIEAYLDGDRDLEARRAMARTHAAAAREATDEALGPDDEPARRAKALGDVGRALALDPENADALRTLVRLLTQPPRRVPREVRDGQRAATISNIRRGGIAASFVYGYISLNGFSTVSLGVRDWGAFWTAHGLWGAALLASLATVFRPSYVTLGAAFLFGVGASAWVTNVYSPFLLVPSFLTMHAFLFALVRNRRLRAAFVAVVCLMWTLVVFGEAHGLFADTVTFTDAGVFIRSPAIELPETATTLYLYAAVLAVILVPAFVIGALRSSYDAADEKMRLQAWQLQRLVPDEAARSIKGALD